MKITTVIQEGLRGILSDLQLANQYIKEIQDTLALITSNGNISIDDRINAYQKLAALEQNCRYLALDKNVMQAFYQELQPKLDAYLAQIPVWVPNPGSGDMAPVMYKYDVGDVHVIRTATVMDFIKAINSGDTSRDFSVAFHLNEGSDSLRFTSWFTDAIDKKCMGAATYVGSPHDSGWNQGNQVDWRVVGCSGCNKDWDASINTSVSVLYGAGVGRPDNTQGETKTAYDSLYNFLRDPGV
jgi:hypothetical protein